MQSGSRRKLEGRYPSEIRLVNGAEHVRMRLQCPRTLRGPRALRVPGNISPVASSKWCAEPSLERLRDGDVLGITVDFTSRPGIIARACERIA